MQHVRNGHLSLFLDIHSAGELCRSKKVFLHTDAAQAIGKVLVDVEAQKIDLMSISGHKIYGPKGTCFPNEDVDEKSAVLADCQDYVKKDTVQMKQVQNA